MVTAFFNVLLDICYFILKQQTNNKQKPHQPHEQKNKQNKQKQTTKNKTKLKQ